MHRIIAIVVAELNEFYAVKYVDDGRFGDGFINERFS